MTSTEKNLKRLLGIIALDQTYLTFSLPVMTFIFYDAASRLLPSDTSYAVRSMWFGTCISTPYLINLFFAPILSSFSDEFGRRIFLLFEISSAFLFMLLAGLGVLFGNLTLFMLGIIIRGAFSRTNTTAIAMIGDASPPSKKMAYMGHLQVAISCGACIGPFISGFFANRFFFNVLNFSMPFFIGAGLALINTILTYFLIDETLKQSTSSIQRSSSEGKFKANWNSIKYVMTHADVIKISLILLLFQISWSTYYQFIGPLLKTLYHFDAGKLGIFVGMIAFWLMLGSGPLFHFMHKKLDTQDILNISATLMLAGISIALAVYFHLLPSYMMWAGAAPIAIGDVLAYICITTLYSNTVADHMQGKVVGINFLIVGLIWGGSGFIGGVLTGYSPILPLLLAPIGIIGALFIINSNSGKEIVLCYAPSKRKLML